MWSGEFRKMTSACEYEPPLFFWRLFRSPLPPLLLLLLLLPDDDDGGPDPWLSSFRRLLPREPPCPLESPESPCELLSVSRPPRYL